MKTLSYYSVTLLSSLFLLISSTISAFNYTVSFTASGASNTIDKVIVQNLTQSTTITVTTGNTLQLTAINQISANDETLHIYPNPIKDKATVSYYSNSGGNTTINVFGVDGRNLVGMIKNLNIGVNTFQLTLPKGAYAIQFNENGTLHTAKILSQSNYTAGIEFTGFEKTASNSPQKAKTTAITMPYNQGDLILYKGFSGNYVSVMTDIVTASKTMNFNFVECKDADGNYYSTVTIGTQVWMAENLKTTKYNDGTSISNVTDNTTWGSLSTSAYCWYNNDITTYKNTYGALYNWYAANTNIIAPIGWHVPRDAEWIILQNYLITNGYNYDGTIVDNKIGKALSANTDWLIYTVIGCIGNDLKANNRSGFTALPGGIRINTNGNYGGFGSYGYWWSLTEYNVDLVWWRNLKYNYNNPYRSYMSKNNGFSIRCVYNTNEPILLPTVTTTDASMITSNSATSGGSITSDGGANLTARGVCWSTNANPTVADSKTTDGIGTSSFTSSLTGLTSNNIYHIRAYATNSIGTSYGNDITFSTLAGWPTITTTSVSSIAQATATSGGSITSDGGTSITARGVCWSTTANPTTANSKTVDGTGIGSFTSSITGLTPNTIYYIRAYTTNSEGTTYGNQLIFTTSNQNFLANPSFETWSAGVPTAWTLTTTVGGTVTQSANSTTGNGNSFQIANPTGTYIIQQIIVPPTGVSTFDTNITYKLSFSYLVKVGDGTDARIWSGLVSSAPGVTPLTYYAVPATHADSLLYYIPLHGPGGNIILSPGTFGNDQNGYLLDNRTSGTWHEYSYSFKFPSGITQFSFAVRTYAGSTVIWDDFFFGESTKPLLPVISSTDASIITTSSALSGGNISNDGGAAVTARGVCWSTSTNPTTANSKTTDGTGTGSFTSNLTGLTANTIYHIRAYATNSIGTSYGSDVTFTTLVNYVLPTLTTTSASSIAQTTATSGGNITSDGGASVTARGVCWSTTPNPTTSNSKTTDGTGTGSFASSLTSLTANAVYHIRAYATNSLGTSYGSDVTFTTLANLPTITTTSASSIAQTTATSGGNISTEGGASVTARGVCWSISANPTIANSKTTDGTGTGSFKSSLTGLTANTVYHIRAYATNSLGTAYGSDVTCTTLANLPTITTSATSGIAQTTATSGGSISTDGGANVTARGVCWSTSTNPIITNSKTTDGIGTGSFISNLTALTANTIYHIRAYATNSAGTSYGSDVTFTTLANLTVPTVTTTTASSITSNSAISGGNITSDGGAIVIARGICWSTSQNPTTANSKTTDGSGTGSFSSSLTGLAASTTYYFRAYATNSVGTAYGNQVSITTSNQYGFYIGKLYGGGIIYYIDGTGQHGLIAAENDQSSSAIWGCFGTNVPGTSTDIGQGAYNTSNIISWCLVSGTAAYISKNIVLNGYNGWYLPSKDELNLMYLNKNVLGTYASYGYWSSSQYDANYAWGIVFGNGTIAKYQKVQSFSVRAIRTF
ncbi:MAG: FISUMP domain-containing protein [Paludibacter sp.]